MNINTRLLIITLGALIISMLIFLLANTIRMVILDLETLNIFSQTPVETITLDAGLTGFIFIFLNGFLLSKNITAKKLDNMERLMSTVGLGFGTTTFLMILLGLLWKITLITTITSQIILTTILLAAAFSRKKISLTLKMPQLTALKNKRARTPSLFKTILLVTISTYTTYAIYRTIAYPTVEWDSLAYGVNYAKIIFEKEKIPLIAGPSVGLEMSANYPPGIQLIAVYLYTFAGAANDFYYRILQPIFGLAVMLATYKFALNITKNRNTSLLALTILIAVPIFWELIIHETYLMYLTLMLTLAAYFLHKAFTSQDQTTSRYETLGAIFCGFSALISYIGLTALGIIILYSFTKKIHKRRFLELTMLAALIMLPWYTRNMILLGNPVYPFLGFGKYLNSKLITSTLQHFQNWLKNPFYGITSNIAKVMVIVLVGAIAYHTFRKREKNFSLLLALYLSMVGISIMSFHIPFPRYLLTALPIVSIILSMKIAPFLAKSNPLKNTFATAILSLIIVSSITVIPSINLAKPAYIASSKWDYIAKAFEEGEAWKWINENTDPNATIATFDIKEYYIERKILPLDGYEAIPLYETDSINKGIEYLKEQNVTHVLSAPYASPLDIRMPPAYEWCILTRYFGDPRYLPPVFVSSTGATVYNVGPLKEEQLSSMFSEEGFIPPIKHVNINQTVTPINNTNSCVGKFYLPIPVDYGDGLMIMSVKSYGHLVNIEMWKGIIRNETDLNDYGTESILIWPFQSDNLSKYVVNPSFVWRVDNAGYFTFIIRGENNSGDCFNVTVDIKFYNYWDIKPLFAQFGISTYNITLSEETFPLLKALYVEVDELSVLSVNVTTFGKKVSLEIYEEFLPNNIIADWSEQYQLLVRQPSLEGEGMVNPTIVNMLLPPGRYSIILVYRDSDMKLSNILLEMELVKLKDKY